MKPRVSALALFLAVFIQMFVVIDITRAPIAPSAAFAGQPNPGSAPPAIVADKQPAPTVAPTAQTSSLGRLPTVAPATAMAAYSAPTPIAKGDIASLPRRQKDSRPGLPPPTPTPVPARADCDPAYPDKRTCIPPGPPFAQGCAITAERRFTVLPPDPQRLDHDLDGVGCETIASR